MKAKQTGLPPLPQATGSGPKPLPCRLAQLYRELKEVERNFDADGNDEASCATFAAAERLREVVECWMQEHRTLSPNDQAHVRRGEPKRT